MVKVIEKIRKASEENKTLYSFEYFPPKTNDGVRNLYDRLSRMALFEPTWVDVTWGAGGSTSQLTLEICLNAQSMVGLDVMMHMTCTNMPQHEILEYLKKAKDGGLQNILALRGDPPRGEEWKQHDDGLARAVDLVRLIRENFGDHFCIAVAGYPEAHLEAVSYEHDLQYLKEKIDAGADFVITQLFYDCDLFLKFVQDCRNIGITCPIVPGIMPIHTYAGFKRMTTLCKTTVPDEIFARLEPIRDDDEKVKEYGIELGAQMCKKLTAANIRNLHFYTLNLEKSVAEILSSLELCKSTERKSLPWCHEKSSNRSREDVRPVFWNKRPQSYLARTATWDEFPNGRWGDSRSPAYGDLNDYHLMSLNKQSVDFRTMWGTPQSPEDVFETVSKYCSGQIPALPWADQPISSESNKIKKKLIWLNKQGILTINSQPAVAGVPSSDKIFGWGPPGGFIFQKEYVEFFISPDRFQKFLDYVKRFPTITYQAVNVKGQTFSNCQTPNAITWGVFIGQEIKQPTIVELTSFLVWKDEAYGLWKSQWINLYEEGSVSRTVLQEMHDNYYLVNVVENNFMSGDIFAVFNAFLGESSSPSA